MSTIFQTYGQGCCSGGTPLSSNLGIQPIGGSKLQFQLTYDYNTQRDLVSGTEKLNDDLRRRNTHSILLRGSFALSKKISITGLLSWVQQEEEITVLSSGKTNKIKVNGLGDIVLLGQYNAFQNANSTLVFAAGATIPTGSTEELDEDGIAYNQDMQPGSGAWDIILGSNFTLNHFLVQNLTLVVLPTYRHTTEHDRFNGLQRYRFGREFQTYAGFNYSTLISALVVNPSLLFRYRTTGPNQINSIDVQNTSGHWLHLVPGLDINISPEMGIGLKGEIPLYRKLEGTQLTTSWNIRISFNYSFPNESSL